MTLVLDASAAVAGLLDDGPARQLIAGQALHVPHLVDSEIASVLRRHVSAGRLDAEGGTSVIRRPSCLMASDEGDEHGERHAARSCVLGLMP